MTVRQITAINAALITALGGTVADTDSVYIDKYAIDFNPADLSAYDLTRLELGSGYSGRMTSAGQALKCVVNQAGAGLLINRSNSPQLEITSSSAAGVIATFVNAPSFNGTVKLDTCKPTVIYQPMPSTQTLGASCDLSHASGLVVITKGRCVLEKTLSAATYKATEVTVGGDAVIDCGRDVGIVNCEGGGTFRCTSDHCSPTTVNMRGGVFVMGPCSGITTLQGNCGVVDQTGVCAPVTIGTMNLAPTVTILRSSRTVAPTVTTDNSPAGGPKISYVD